MNLRRGFHRLFLVFSAFWFALALFLRTESLDRELRLHQSKLEEHLQTTAEPVLPERAAGTVLSRDEFINRYGAKAYAADTVYLDTDGNTIRAGKDNVASFDERLRRQRMADGIEVSTLSPLHVVTADYDESGRRITLPPGYTLESIPASRRLNLKGVGVLEFPGELSDEALLRLLQENFRKDAVYDIVDLIAAEAEGRRLAAECNQRQLSEILSQRRPSHRLLSVFDAEHWMGTVTWIFGPLATIYAVIAGGVIALIWIARGFRAPATRGSESNSETRGF